MTLNKHGVWEAVNAFKLTPMYQRMIYEDQIGITREARWWTNRGNTW